MKKVIFAALVALLLPCGLRAQDIITNDQSDDYYSDEQGFFQKAYRDKSDPRFMFRDGQFEFGVGGRIQTAMYYDFAGAIDNIVFKTSSISIPSDITPNYGMAVCGSNVYFKARGQIGKHKVLAFTGIESDKSNTAIISQAYISFDNFTLGKTYSFFSDLEAGSRTVDGYGANSEINKVHPLVGFTWRISPKMTLAAAFEEAEVNLSSYDEYGIDTEYQSSPDVAMHFKYRFNEGHIQLAGLARNIGYWVFEPPRTSDTDGETRYTFAWGSALSGNWNPAERVRFSAQAFAGSGISSYIRDFVGCGLSLAMEKEFSGGYAVLRPRFMTGGYVSSQIKWNNCLSSNFMGGYARVNMDADTYCGSQLKSTLMASANIIYDLSNYCFMGLEYIHGRADNYPEEAFQSTTGRANRIIFVFSYAF